MASCLVDTKPLLEPVLTNFLTRKCLWKCCLQNVFRFVDASICYHTYKLLIFGYRSSNELQWFGMDERVAGLYSWLWPPVSELQSVTGEFPAQKASNAENVSIWWRHHVTKISGSYLFSFWKNIMIQFHSCFADTGASGDDIVMEKFDKSSCIIIYDKEYKIIMISLFFQDNQKYMQLSWFFSLFFPGFGCVYSYWGFYGDKWHKRT